MVVDKYELYTAKRVCSSCVCVRDRRATSDGELQILDGNAMQIGMATVASRDREKRRQDGDYQRVSLQLFIANVFLFVSCKEKVCLSS